MKRLLLTVLAALAGTFAVHAQSIRDLDIRVELAQDGSARITQVWDVNVNSGTEWYVPISNLGKMSITDFSVSENGLTFYNEGRHWDVDRSLSEKAGRCGIVDKRDTWNCAGDRAPSGTTSGRRSLPPMGSCSPSPTPTALTSSSSIRAIPLRRST